VHLVGFIIRKFSSTSTELLLRIVTLTVMNPSQYNCFTRYQHRLLPLHYSPTTQHH